MSTELHNSILFVTYLTTLSVVETIRLHRRMMG